MTDVIYSSRPIQYGVYYRTIMDTQGTCTIDDRCDIHVQLGSGSSKYRTTLQIPPHIIAEMYHRHQTRALVHERKERAK